MTYLRRKECRILYGFPKGEGVGDAGIFLCEIGRGKELLFMSLMEGEERVKEPCWRLFFVLRRRGRGRSFQSMSVFGRTSLSGFFTKAIRTKDSVPTRLQKGEYCNYRANQA